MASDEPGLSLIQRAVGGDTAALEELLLDHYDRLAGRIGHKMPRRLRPVVSVEDILQQTFAEVFRRIGTFEPKGSGAFSHWLAEIADHRLADAMKAEQAAKRGGRHHLRRAAGTDSDSMDRLVEMVAGPEETPSQSVARKEAVAAVQVGLASLPDEYRRPVEMRYLEGLSVAQVAEALNVKPRTVRGLCYRALKELRAVLGRSTQFFSRK